MRQRNFAVISALAFATVMITGSGVGTAHASDRYPWCAVYSQRTVGATNCGFTTLAQCLATISGVGGSCEPNPAYVPPPRRKSR